MALVVPGTNVGPGVDYTVDQPIRLAFNRFLNPVTVTRQSVLLEDSGGNLFTDEIVAYDPVTLTVTLTNPGAPLPWLTVGEEYRVTLPIASADGGSGSGLLAIDGAPMGEATTVIFTAGPAARHPAAPTPEMHFCADVLPVLQAKCTYSGACHAAPSDGSAPAAGLALDSEAGLVHTAIGRVANGSNTGATASVESLAPGSPFGIDMAIIQGGEPGLSWLLYKVLLADPTSYPDGVTGACGGTYTPNAAFGSNLEPYAGTAERELLGNYILGRPMPYPANPTDAGPSTPGYELPLSMGELERLSAWIAQGATFDQTCGACN